MTCGVLTRGRGAAGAFELGRIVGRHETGRLSVLYTWMFLSVTTLYLVYGARCWWRSWLRHCATSRKVTGSVPDGVTGIFH